MRGRIPIVALGLLLVVESATAQALPLHASAGQHRIEAADAWLAGGFVAGTVLLAPLDRSLAHILQDSSRQESRVLQTGAHVLRILGFPGSIIIGASMYGVGRAGGMPELAAFGLHGTEAIVLSYSFVWLGKNLLGRARPAVDIDNPFDFQFGRGFQGNDLYRSFPSGHTAAAFAIAMAITAEAGKIWPDGQAIVAPILFTGATLVGMSRMYNNRHWATDVLGGAIIGIFTGAKLVDYLYAHDTTLDRWLLPSSRAPARWRNQPTLRGPPIVLAWRVAI